MANKLTVLKQHAERTKKAVAAPALVEVAPGNEIPSTTVPDPALLEMKDQIIAACAKILAANMVTKKWWQFWK